MTQPFAILDPAAGISGDMLLGALVGAGAPRAWLEGVPARLGFPDVRITIETVDRCSVSSVKVTVTLPGGVVESPADLVAAGSHEHRHDEPDHHHHHEVHHQSAGEAGHDNGPHRHVSELITIAERAPVSAWVRDRAVRAFRLLGESEARIHGGRAEDVALHEVGAVDAIIDIIGGIEGLEQLGISTVYNRPVALGRGWVRAAHGALPVPAPATAILVEGMEIASGGPVEGEATTPTGAVLLKVLSAGAPPARWRMRGSAWGAGTRNPGTYPNALRLILAEVAAEAGETVMIATDIDDLNPEYLEALREALVAAGALDVQVWSTQMKKGRTGFRLEVVSPEGAAAGVTEALFRHSTTIGVRRWRAERVTLSRREITVPVEGGTVRVKVVDAPGGSRLKPEYEDLAALAVRLGRPLDEVAFDVRQRARLIIGDSAGDDTYPNKEK
ncbi:MAG: nickel pincer cofactor biosynthesis protein LarC [Gemmatimonadota bacterium]